MSSCQPCMLSAKQVSATHMCQVCNEKYCPSCTRDHNKFGALRGHRIVSIGTENDRIYEKYDSAYGVPTVKNDEGVCASDEYKDYDYADPHGDRGASTHFYIDVEDTELSGKIGIGNKQCLLLIEPNTMLVSISHNFVRKIDFSFTIVRKYGIVSKLSNRFTFELGRRCQFGEGELTFKCKDCRSLFDFISNSEKLYCTSSCSYTQE